MQAGGGDSKVTPTALARNGQVWHIADMARKRTSRRRAMRKKNADQKLKQVLDSIEQDPHGAIDRTVKFATDVQNELGTLGEAARQDPEGFKRAIAAEGLRLLVKLAK